MYSVSVLLSSSVRSDLCYIGFLPSVCKYLLAGAIHLIKATQNETLFDGSRFPRQHEYLLGLHQLQK